MIEIDFIRFNFALKEGNSKQFLCKDGFLQNQTYHYYYLWNIVVKIHIIIIMSCRQHGYPWPSLSTFPIIHRLWQVFRAASRIFTELLFVCSSWSSYLARLYVGVHRSTSLMSSSLLLQQCPACLVRLTWIVFVIGGRWPYSWCLVGCCRQDLFNIVCNILV